MATISFLYRSTKEESLLKIRFFYRLDNKNAFVEITSKIKVTKEYWEKYHNAKRVNDIKLKNKQAEITSAINDLEQFIINASENASVSSYSKEWLVAVVGEYYNPKVEQSVVYESTLLIDWFDRYVQDRKADASLATIKKANAIKQLVLRFQKHEKKKLHVRDVGVKFKTAFEDYCLNQGYAQNTTARNMVFIKTICNHAKIYDVEVSNTLDLFKAKREKVKSVYLNLDDIAAIENLVDLSDILDSVRDWLLISCYTGQRVSDFMRFEKSMIRYQENRKGDLKPLIEFTQQKTQKLISIPLVTKVLNILDKRKGEFPMALSDQKYNEYLKEVCKLAQLNERVEGSKKVEQADKVWRNEKGVFEKWELVSSHIGRRSFATNNYGKIPTVFLMNMTGHGSESMFLTYIGKGSKDIAIELSEYFD